MRVFVIMLAMVAAVPAANGQQAAAPRPPTVAVPVNALPSSRPRVGYAAAPAPPEAAPAVRRPVYFTQGSVISTGASYVVLSDGTVAVNFGNGYERVLRSCAASNTTAVSPSDARGRDALGRIPDPPGIAALRPGARGPLAGSMPSRNVVACFRTDAQGRLEVVTH